MAHEFAGQATRAAEQAQVHAARVRDIVGGVDRPVLRRALRARDAANTVAAAARRADRAAQASAERASAAAGDVPAAGKPPADSGNRAKPPATIAANDAEWKAGYAVKRAELAVQATRDGDRRAAEEHAAKARVFAKQTRQLFGKVLGLTTRSNRACWRP